MKKALRFSIVICVLSWILYSLVMGLCRDVVTSNRVNVVLLEIAFMAVPLFATFFAQWRSGDSSAFKLLDINISSTWLVGILLMVLAIVLCCPISVLLPGIRFHFGPEQLMEIKHIDTEVAEQIRTHLNSMPAYAIIGGAVARGLVYGLTISTVFSLGEEFVWRGYLLKLLNGCKFWKTALFVGFFNGIWHAPVVLFGHIYPQHPILGVPMMTVQCILTGAMIQYFTLKTKSVVIAAAMHGVLNGLIGVIYIMTLGGNDLTVGFTGVAGFITLGLVLTGIYHYDKFISKENIMSSPIEI